MLDVSETTPDGCTVLIHEGEHTMASPATRKATSSKRKPARKVTAAKKPATKSMAVRKPVKKAAARKTARTKKI